VAQETIIDQANEFVENTLEHARDSLDQLPKKTRKRFDDLNLDVASLPNASVKRLSPRGRPRGSKCARVPSPPWALERSSDSSSDFWCAAATRGPAAHGRSIQVRKRKGDAFDEYS
jgi:hypothetical protein